MNRYLSQEARRVVAERAGFRCEYCLISEDVSYLSYQIDHIVSIKHGGDHHLDNLAYSCVSCNRAKGSDIGSVLLPQKTFIRLFNPREDSWQDHFRIVGAEIVSRSDIGKVTIKILDLNNLTYCNVNQTQNESALVHFRSYNSTIALCLC